MKDYITYLEQFVTESRTQIFKMVLAQRTKHFTLVLEDLYQMHNLSAVIRSADIFGWQDVHIIQQKYDPKLSHAIARGAEKWLDIHRYSNTKTAIDTLRKKGYKIVATTPHTDDILLHEFNINEKSAFFFGVEKDGISDLVMNEADVHLKIPMYGFTESFNISVAAALIMHHVTEKLRTTDMKWQLAGKEKELIYRRWLEKSIKSIELIKKNFIKKQ